MVPNFKTMHKLYATKITVTIIKLNLIRTVSSLVDPIRVESTQSTNDARRFFEHERSLAISQPISGQGEMETYHVIVNGVTNIPEMTN